MNYAGLKESFFSVYQSSKHWLFKTVLRKNIAESHNVLFIAVIASDKYILGKSDGISVKLTNLKVVTSIKDIINYIVLNEIEKNQIHMVLCDDRYKLTIHEMPDIPDDDLQDAIRWQIDDELGINTENSAIDAFKVPDQGRIQSSGYLVTKPLKEVETIQKSFQELSASVKVLTIAELGLVKLLAHLAPKQEGVLCILYISAAGQVHIIITRDGALLFCRKLGIKDILLHPDSQNSLMDECKRSFAYIKNQRQMVVSKICLLQKLPTDIQKSLAENLNITVDVIDPGQLMPAAHELSRSEYPFYLPLAGVAIP